MAAVDWSPPWLAPYRADGDAVERAMQGGASTAAALSEVARRSGEASTGSARTGRGDRTDAGEAPRFVPHDALPPGEPYERFIFDTGGVPTRDNPHDFFNGLVWLRFPQAKRRLNALQAGEIARLGIGATRGPLRDALTLFDENGAVLDAPAGLRDALVARDWHRLFVTERARWREARLLVFGHALLEKLVAPRKPATAHVLLAPAGARSPSLASTASTDEAIAAMLQAAHLATKPFVALPVLGVPGWWPPNEDPAFYGDSGVFRPPRSAESPPAPQAQARSAT